jgi:hypothetical protein
MKGLEVRGGCVDGYEQSDPRCNLRAEAAQSDDRAEFRGLEPQEDSRCLGSRSG